MEYNSNIFRETLEFIEYLDLDYKQKMILRYEYTTKFFLDSPAMLISLKDLPAILNIIKEEIFTEYHFGDVSLKSLIDRELKQVEMDDEYDDLKSILSFCHGDIFELKLISKIKTIRTLQNLLKKIKNKELNTLIKNELLNIVEKVNDVVDYENYIFISYTAVDTVYAVLTCFKYKIRTGMHCYIYELANELPYPLDKTNIQCGKNLLTKRITEASAINVIHTKSLSKSVWVIWEYGVSNTKGDQFISKYYLTTGKAFLDILFADLNDDPRLV